MDRQYGFSDTVDTELQRSKKSTYISFVILLLLVIGMTIWQSSRGRKNMQIRWEETALTITDPSNAVYTLDYSDLKQISYREGWDFGTCTSGAEDNSYKYGTWENEEIGTYRLYAAQGCSSVILLESDTEKTAISYESDQITRELYSAIIPTLAESGFHPAADPEIQN